MVTIVYCPSCLFSETWFSEQISFNYRFLKIIILSKGIQDWVLQIFHHRMKHFIAKKAPISEHQRGNGINILVFKTRVKAAVFQGIQRLHQKKVHLLARYITGWRPRAKNELLKIMQLSNIFTTQYFALSILLIIISLKKHESSKQQYRWCTHILQTEKLSQRIHSIVKLSQRIHSIVRFLKHCHYLQTCVLNFLSSFKF